ncbi:MAG TPA: hypothetical protein VGN57_05370 [Pirellulaceae bacterium]|jgi:hypothetical protein|nr:hypothetical protein [Pirellulaceae bacterium]
MTIAGLTDESVTAETLGVRLARAKVRRRRGWKIAGAIAVATLALLVIAYLVVDAVDRQVGEAAIARVRAAGDPVTPRELEAFYVSSPEIERATHHWKRAFKAVESGDTTAALGETRLAREAGAVGRFPRSLDETDSELTLEHLEGLSSVMHYLKGRPRIHASVGDIDEAAETLLDMVAVNEALRNEPVGSSFLSRCSLLGTASSDAIQTLGNCQYDEEHLTAIQHASERQNLHAHLLHAMRGEQALVLQAYDRGIAGAPDLERIRKLPFRGGDRAKAVEWFQAYLKGAEGGWAETAQATDDADAMLEEILDSTFDTFRYSFGTHRMHYPAMLLDCAQRTQTDANVVVALAARRRYRLANGEWPESLEALVPKYLSAVPVDPIAVQPLAYERDGDVIRFRTQAYTTDFTYIKLPYLDSTGRHVFDAASFETAE